MKDRMHLIIGRKNDLMTGPLQQFLSQASNKVRLGASASDYTADTTDIWFADHVSYLVYSSQVKGQTSRRHVLLRPGQEIDRQPVNLSLAFMLAQSNPDIITQFWALRSDLAEDLSTTHGVDVQYLGAGPNDPASRASLLVDASQMTIGHPDNPALTLPLRKANLARVARRYNLVCNEVQNADGHCVVALANSARSNQPRSSDRVLFILPHGAGLGHMSRCLAVAHQLGSMRCDFLVYNAAAYLVGAAGHHVIHRQSAISLNANSNDWRAWERVDLLHYITTNQPSAVIVDASNIDPFIAETLAHPAAVNTALIWIRREMWRKDRLRLANVGALHCDAIIIPDELAAFHENLASDVIATLENGFAKVHNVAPVTLPTVPLSRPKARKALGLGRGRICLISLGAWEDAQHEQHIATIITAAKKHKIKLVSVRSPLAGPSLQDKIFQQQITAYPMAQYFAAFDGVISTAGYNSFHELIHLYSGPVMFLPVDKRGLDDQVARARFAAQNSLADIIDPRHPTQSAEAFFLKLRNKQTIDRPASRENGAHIAARAIMHCIKTYQEGVND